MQVLAGKPVGARQTPPLQTDSKLLKNLCYKITLPACVHTAARDACLLAVLTPTAGTIVYEGKLDGRAVAVKRLLRQFYDLAKKEIEVRAAGPILGAWFGHVCGVYVFESVCTQTLSPCSCLLCLLTRVCCSLRKMR